jgi:2-polyprenyl-6-methoxyphenol hydroxylase-like FAD-dependent oxidoreductase
MTPQSDAEVVIAGAGISGLALALALGRRGREVCLVDRAPAPRDKVCGEGIMPLGLRCLDALGVDARAMPGADFDGLDFLASKSAGERSARRHGLRFPPGMRGRGVRRTRLVEALQEAALACPTVRCEMDEVRGVERRDGRAVALIGRRARYGAAVLVAADGVHSRLARWCEAGAWRYGERLAVRRHYRLPREAMPARVQVGHFGTHDVYLTPVGPEELVATTLTDRSGFSAIRRDYDGFLRGCPFGQLFAAAEPVSECLAWYHPLFHVRRYVAAGVFMVGDAGGGIDPCLGMGMSLALWTALAAGDAISAAIGDSGARRDAPAWRNAERAFAGERERLYLHYHHFGRVFRALVGSARGARALVRAMGLLPQVADRMLAIVADLRPWRSLGAHRAAGPSIPEQRAVR